MRSCASRLEVDSVLDKNRQHQTLPTPGLANNWGIGLVAFIGVLGLVVVVGHLLDLETDLVEEMAVDDAARFSEALGEFRTLYTSEVVERALTEGVKVTHNYQDQPGALPLPATLSMLLGTRLSEEIGGSVRLYSDYPFPGGQNTGMTLDAFEKMALQRLREDPSHAVFEFQPGGEGTVLRYATADRMRPSCVNCHNTHPESPKTDWLVGDVRGVLEVTRPMSPRALATSRDLRSTVWMLLGISLLALGAISVAANRIRRARVMVSTLASDTALARDELERETIERQRAQKDRDLIEAQALQTQKLESLGLLAGGIAHDFNNLLVSILGNADLVDFHLADESPARQHLELLKKGGVQASGLTSQLLAYAGHGPMSTRNLDLSETVTDIAQVLQTVVARNATIVYDIPPDLPSVDADPAQLEQVVLNLLTNAADALADKPGTIILRTGCEEITNTTLSRSVHGEGLRTGRYVYLEVEDDGCGMNEATRLQMFDPFYTTKQQGRGLGLAAIQGIVRAHQGAVHVVSEPGAGTTIRVLLPCSDSPPETATSVRQEPLPSASNYTVLVVDDDDNVRTTTVQLLEHHGFTVLSASSGQDGIELLKEQLNLVDGAVLDMTMPGLGGIETYERMAAMKPSLRVVFVSGFTVESNLKEFSIEGDIYFLQKPFKTTDLVQQLLG